MVAHLKIYIYGKFVSSFIRIAFIVGIVGPRLTRRQGIGYAPSGIFDVGDFALVKWVPFDLQVGEIERTPNFSSLINRCTDERFYIHVFIEWMQRLPRLSNQVG